MEEVEGLISPVLLGSGGFADVYRAHEPAFNRDVAVKVFRDHLDDRGRQSFDRETRAAGRLSGIRNVVQVYRSDVAPSGRPYLVMQLMHGSLEDVLVLGSVPVPTACSAGALLGHALGEAHARGILHRDIKPANVLIDRYGEPALSDFGIASLADAAPSMTIGAAFTAEHAAPEIFDGAATSEASDVYSLASTVFTMMEGHPPFVRRDDEGPLPFMQRIRNEPCPPCTATLQVSAELSATIMAALSKNATDRPTVDELVAGLRAHSGGAAPVLSAEVGALVGSPRPTGGSATNPPPVLDGVGSPHGAGWTLRRSALAATVAIIVAVGAGLVVTAGSDPASDEVAADRGSSTTSSAPLATTAQRRDGVTNLRPATDSSLTDSSAMLRARINTFAAGSSVPVLSQPPLKEISGVDLDLGKPPGKFDYAATNALRTTECRELHLDDLVVQGAAGAIWFDGRQLVLVNAVELLSELQAQQYFWATALFLGLRDDDCAGWPSNQIAVNPDDLELDRRDFDFEVAGDDVVTAINNDPDYGGISTGLSYEAVFRAGTTVVVASVGYTTSGAGADPSSAAVVLGEVAAAFGLT